VSGTDDVFGIDAFKMRARIFDDIVVAAFDRPIAGNRDDRMRMDTGGNRCCGHRLEDRVVWRHAKQTARTQVARVDLEVAGIARKFDAGADDAQRESKKPAQELGDRIFSEVAATVRRGDGTDRIDPPVGVEKADHPLGLHGESQAAQRPGCSQAAPLVLLLPMGSARTWLI
jgi:hypothetical protein